MKKTIISLGIVVINLCTSFALPISAQNNDSSKRQNSSKSIQSNGFSFELLGCQLTHAREIGTSCNFKIMNKENSPRILRYRNYWSNGTSYHDNVSNTSHFSDSSGYLHRFVGCDAWKISEVDYCQDTFQANESKTLSTQSKNTGIKKNDSLNTIVLMFDLIEASGRKRFEVIFNKNKTGEISVAIDAPIVYAENAKAQDTVQQEVKVEGLKFQLLYCRNFGKDINYDGIEDGICEFKVTNTSNTAIGLAGHNSGDAIDLGGNKHLSQGILLNKFISLTYEDGRYFVEAPNYAPIGRYTREKIYPGVTIRGTVSVKNIFPDNTAFKSLNIGLKIIIDKKEKEISVVFRAKNIPILPAK